MLTNWLVNEISLEQCKVEPFVFWLMVENKLEKYVHRLCFRSRLGFGYARDKSGRSNTKNPQLLTFWVAKV